MIRWLLRVHDTYVKHLEAEIEYYRLELKNERRRAEQAIDTLLTLKGASAVTPPEPRGPTPEERAVQEFLSSPELAKMGGVD